MKTLKEYINESNIKLPYNFYIYNEGPKNADYSITKKTIYNVFMQASKNYDCSPTILLPLPADNINYAVVPTKESTDNWTKIPKIRDYTSAEAYYSNKRGEYSYYEYNKDWSTWFNMLKPYMRGKVGVTLKFNNDKDVFGKILTIEVNNEAFNKAREERLKELSNTSNLKKWADEATAKEKAEIEREAKEAEKKKQQSEAFNKWWNSLSDSDKMSWTMGYGRGSGTWTGD